MKKESNKNFNFLLTASAFSNLADGIAAFAYPWLFSLITRDPLLISLTVFLTTLPQLIFVLFAGVIADKFNRKSILIFTRILQVLLTLSFVLLIYFYLDNLVYLTNYHFNFRTGGHTIVLSRSWCAKRRDENPQKFLACS